jgi:hypothetical protein
MRQHYMTPVTTLGPPLWSSGQSSWLQIPRSGFDSWCYQIFWEVAGLERGPPRLVRTEELLGRKSTVSRLEIREYGSRDLSRRERGTLYPQKLTLTSPTSGGRSVGIVRSRIQATEFSLIWVERVLSCSRDSYEETLANIRPLPWQTKMHTHTKQQAQIVLPWQTKMHIHWKQQAKIYFRRES